MKIMQLFCFVFFTCTGVTPTSNILCVFIFLKIMGGGGGGGRRRGLTTYLLNEARLADNLSIHII